jgi:hypothetical protein
MNDLTVLEKPLTALEIRTQVNTIQSVLKEVMQKDVHYGVIPGCKEPSLYKPGAEKIMATFRLSAEPFATDLSTLDCIRYQVTVRLVSPTGVFVGAGIGECSTNEDKYKWRRAVCDEEWEETEPSRRREKWGRDWKKNQSYKTKQVRTEPADLANTVLKMAKKRAQIDAVLTATAASDIFTQDIEDLPAEYLQDEQPKQRPAPQPKTVSDIQKGFANEKQQNLLFAKLKNAGKTVEDLCEAFGITALSELPFAKVNDAIAWITQ